MHWESPVCKNRFDISFGSQNNNAPRSPIDRDEDHIAHARHDLPVGNAAMGSASSSSGTWVDRRWPRPPCARGRREPWP
eukprot:1796158-Lingulodinium_polyedra.AAC.1